MIMVVEDSRQMRKEIRNFLNRIRPENEILECSNGKEAVEAYALHRPSLVLMDIRMDTMDGLMATKIIMQSYPAAKIVIVTNFDDTDLREAAYRAGAIGYVLKDNLKEIQSFIGMK